MRPLRESRADTGSSCVSCGTSWPEKAFFKMDWRRASIMINHQAGQFNTINKNNLGHDVSGII